MKKVYVLLMAILCFQASFAALSKKDPLAKFSGRVSNLNLDARLVRFKVNFDNIKFLNKGDEVDFWWQHQEKNKCYPNNRSAYVTNSFQNRRSHFVYLILIGMLEILKSRISVHHVFYY